MTPGGRPAERRSMAWSGADPSPFKGKRTTRLTFFRDGVAPAPAPGCRVRRLVAAGYLCHCNPTLGAKLCRDLGLAKVGLRQHARMACGDRCACQRHVDESFIFEGRVCALELPVCLRTRQALAEVAPI